MRNLEDSQAFLLQLRRIAKRVEESDYGEIFTRKLVADISKWSSEGFDFELRIKGHLKLREMLGLALLHWYTSSDILRIYLQLYLEEKCKTLSEEDQFLVKLFLASKAESEIFLLDTSLWSVRSFFGNVYNEEFLIELLRKIQVSICSMPKPKYPERHRGYRDKGSWKKPHEVHSDYANDYSSLLDQNEIENRQRVLEDTLRFVQANTFSG